MRFPLWDSEMQSFFRNLSFKLRSNKLFYDKTLEEQIFKPMGVFFGEDELNASERTLNKKACCDIALKRLVRHAKKWTKYFMPFYLVEKRMRKNDWICYQKYTSEMAIQMRDDGYKIPRPYNRYNALLCEWYLYSIKKDL